MGAMPEGSGSQHTDVAGAAAPGCRGQGMDPGSLLCAEDAPVEEDNPQFRA